MNPIFARVTPGRSPAGRRHRSLRVHIGHERTPENVLVDLTSLDLGRSVDLASGDDRFTVVDRKAGHVFSPHFNRNWRLS